MEIKTGKIVFEFVGDVNCKYPYVCIYFENEKNPFMEIFINEDNDKYNFAFYSNTENIALTKEQLDEIIKRAKSLNEEVLLNKKFYL